MNRSKDSFGGRRSSSKDSFASFEQQNQLNSLASGILDKGVGAGGVDSSVWAAVAPNKLDAGRFHADAVPSEVRSLKNNIRRHAQHAAAAKKLRAQLAERSAGAGGLSALRERFAQEEAEAANLQNIIDMQKTIPVVRGSTSLMWLGPNQEYSAALGRVKAIEDALAFN